MGSLDAMTKIACVPLLPFPLSIIPLVVDDRTTTPMSAKTRNWQNVSKSISSAPNGIHRHQSGSLSSFWKIKVIRSAHCW